MNGCWHCGEPLPANPPQAHVAGVAHAVCCNGCRAVAEWIGELGLADYYRLRSGSAVRAPDLGDWAKSAAAFQRPELSRHVVRPLADGNSEAIVLIDGVRCAACCWLIERTLGLLPGVTGVSRERRCAARAHRVRRQGCLAHQNRRCARTSRLSGAAARPRGARRRPPPRNARRAKAPRRRRLRRDAGDDVRERVVVRRIRRCRCRDARRFPMADAARGDARRVLCRGAVLRRRETTPRGAPARHGRAGGARRRAHLRRKRRRGRCRGPRRLVRVGQHVRVLPERRPLPRNARPPPRRRPVRRVGAIVSGVRRSRRG